MLFMYPLWPNYPKNTTIRFGRQFARQLDKLWPMDLSQKIKLLALDLMPHAVLFWLDTGWHKVGEPGIRDPR